MCCSNHSVLRSDRGNVKRRLGPYMSLFAFSEAHCKVDGGTGEDDNSDDYANYAAIFVRGGDANNDRVNTHGKPPSLFFSCLQIGTKHRTTLGFTVVAG